MAVLVCRAIAHAEGLAKGPDGAWGAGPALGRRDAR